MMFEKKQRLKFLLSGTGLLLAQIFSCSSGQVLQNPGLNGTTGSGHVPLGWTICQGSPDTQIIQGTGSGIYGINTLPFEGNSYIGLAATSAGYLESFGQPVTLTAGTTYSGSVQLYRSALHTNWNGTGRLQIFGGNDCTAADLLWSSPVITNLNSWQTYPVTFTPAQSFTWLVFKNSFEPGSGTGDYFCMDQMILSPVILPVNGTFEASVEDESVRLHWDFPNSMDAVSITLEWSKDGEHYHELRTSFESDDSALFSGSFLHLNPVPGNNFYRCSITDNNGGVVFSEVLEVDVIYSLIEGIFPNPARDECNIVIHVPEQSPVTLVLINETGQVIFSRTISIQEGTHLVKLELPAEALPGSYHVQASALGFHSVYHLIIH